MVAVLVALALGYLLERKFSPMPIMTAVLVLVFGGLTLYLKNDIFIKMKPTVLYAIFGLTLLGGLAFNRLFLKYLLSLGFEMPDSGLAHADVALRNFLSRARRRERDRVAQFPGAHLGRLQGLGRTAAHSDILSHPGAVPDAPSDRAREETGDGPSA